jgi:hypothetical protein
MSKFAPWKVIIVGSSPACHSRSRKTSTTMRMLSSPLSSATGTLAAISAPSRDRTKVTMSANVGRKTYIIPGGRKVL